MLALCPTALVPVSVPAQKKRPNMEVLESPGVNQTQHCNEILDRMAAAAAVAVADAAVAGAVIGTAVVSIAVAAVPPSLVLPWTLPGERPFA